MRIIKYIFKNYFFFNANTQVFPIAVSVAKNESIDPTKGILNNSCNITVTIINRAKELMAVFVIFLIYSVINIANIGVAISNTTT